jgi:hypothetical protein
LLIDSIHLRQVFNSVKSSGDYTNRPYSFDVYSPDLSFSFCASSDPEKEGLFPSLLFLFFRSTFDELICIDISFDLSEWIRAIGRAIVMVKTKRFVNDDGSDDYKDS